MSRHQKNNRTKKSWRIFKNEDIKAFKILVLDVDWNQLGEMTRSKALQIAWEQWLDLVQVHYDPVKKVCTAKIIDFWKYQYEKKKQESEKRKVQKKKVQKEIKFWYNIGDNDLEMKFRKAVEFLEKWHPVKINVVLRWREKVYKEIVRTKLDALEEKLKEHGKSLWIKNENFWFTLVILSSVRTPSTHKKKVMKPKRVYTEEEIAEKRKASQRKKKENENRADTKLKNKPKPKD